VGDDLATRLRGFDTPTVSDALDALGLPAGVGGFTPYGAARRIAGPARTVRVVLDDGAPRDRHLGVSAIEASVPGAVIVVEHHSRDDCAAWGGLLTVAAQQAGVAGVVVDGSCRDVDDYVDLDFTVLARRAVPTTARGRIVEVESGATVDVGGVAVAPDDLVLGDRSGVVVVPLAAAEDVLEAAARIKRKEELMVADLRAGVRVSTVLGTNYETMLTGSDHG
jgi:regulator of RNase E activity RraA